MATHPFPPLVRWLLFPTLAAMTGAAAAAVTASVMMPHETWEAIAFGAPMAAAGALGFALPGRAWIGMAGAPVLGVTVFCGVYAAYSRATGGAYGNARVVLETLLNREGEWLLAIGVAGFALAAAHRLRLRVRSFWKGGLVYVVAGAFMALAAPLAMSGRDARIVACMTLLMALLQPLAIGIALRLSRPRSEAV